MTKKIEDSEVSEIEKQAIIEIERKIGYNFEILDEDEFFYAFPPIFYSILKPKYGWPPTKYEEIEVKSEIAVCLENNHITGLSLKFQLKLLPIDEILLLPEFFENLKFIKYLVINEIHLYNIHQCLNNLPKLEFLSLRHTELLYVSGLFSNLINLKGIDLGYYSRDFNLIKEICEIPTLQILDLSNTDLEILPDCIQNLSNLKILDLSYEDDIYSFPRNLKELKSLEILRINESEMKIIPKSVQLPQNLKEIDLKDNNFTELPSVFEDLPNLEKIEVDTLVVANYITKTKEGLYREFQNNICENNFSNSYLYYLTKKRTKFLKILLKNEIALYDILNNELMDIKSMNDDLTWICENQITIHKVELVEDVKKGIIELTKLKKIIELSRLNIFIGKNNTGKTHTLKQLYNKCRRITPEEFKKDINCYYIPKNRLYNKIEISGERKGFTKSLINLLNCLDELQKDSDNWSFDKIIGIINFFNSTNKEISELESSERELFNGFRLILKKWLDALHLYFPDIDLKLPKRSEFNTVYEFECIDVNFPSLRYSFNDLGSGMQELAVLIFFIELLKYLPPIKSGKIIELKDYHRMLFIDEPDISLHPELQEQFFKYLINASHRIQITLTTQSPFIPKPVKNYISVKLFRKDTSGFHYDEITNNNFVLIQEELFRYQPLEIASYLSKNNFEYFKELNYKSEELSLGSFIKKRYYTDKNYLGLLKLGTVNWNPEQRILQNSYFLSFSPETVDLNENYEVKQSSENNLRVFIVQLGKIPDLNRRELIEKADKLIRGQKFNLRLLTLCRTIWDKQKFKDYVLCYNLEQQMSMGGKLRQYLSEIEEEVIENKSIILFPENILPYTIIPNLLKYSQEHKVVIIGGMEHSTLENLNKIMKNLSSDEEIKYKTPVDYLKLEPDVPIEESTYLNQAIIINANGNYTFQIKNIPVYFNSVRKKEGIPIILKPQYRKVQTAIGSLAVLICKDLLVNSDVVDTWMNIHNINLLLTPSFTDLVNPFRNRLGEIISNRQQKDKIFVFANVSEYGGSGAYNYTNRRDFEPNKKSLFPSSNEIKEEEFRNSIEGWRKKDFNL